MTFAKTRTVLMSTAIACAALTACAVEELPEDELALEVAGGEALDAPMSEPEILEMAANDTSPACPNERFLMSFDDGEVLGGSYPELADDPEANSCPYDLYFHPNNGSHGGWIEAWRLCHRGGRQYQVCRGGSAPMRYWNPSSCGGTVHRWIGQGARGWAQTGGGCC